MNPSITHTNETGKPTLRCMASAPMFNAARNSADTSDQTGLRFASSPTAMPVNPYPGDSPSGSLWWMPATSPKPARPATPPERTKLKKMTRCTGIPATRAARGFCPSDANSIAEHGAIQQECHLAATAATATRRLACRRVPGIRMAEIPSGEIGAETGSTPDAHGPLIK